MTTINAVTRVRATPVAGAFIVNVDFTNSDGERMIVDVGVTPTDTNGVVPLIRQWLEENAGSYTVQPYEPPTAEQQRAGMPSLTARQLRLGLIDSGVTPAQVQAAIDAMPAATDREKALVEWEYASAFSRTHPLIASIGTALGLAEEQIDEIWMAAINL